MHPHAVVLVTLALATGMAAAFNPCGIGLLPSYVGFLIGSDRPASWGRALPQGLGIGSAMTLGLLTVFGGVALAFSVIAAWIGPRLETVGLLVGTLLGLWGVLMLLWPQRFSLSPKVPSPAGSGTRGAVGAYLYGIIFALASLGCTFPLFLSLLVQAAATGSPVGALRVVLAYAVGMGVIVTGLAVLARLARTLAQRLVYGAGPLLTRYMGAFVLLSGLLVVGYWLYGI